MNEARALAEKMAAAEGKQATGDSGIDTGSDIIQGDSHGDSPSQSAVKREKKISMENSVGGNSPVQSASIESQPATAQPASEPAAEKEGAEQSKETKKSVVKKRKRSSNSKGNSEGR